MEPTTDALASYLELGFAAAGTLAGGFFIVLLIKYILESVVGQVTTIHGMISALDNRVKTMNNEVVGCKRRIAESAHGLERNPALGYCANTELYT